MVTSYLRGHPIYYDGDHWRYVDSDEPTVSILEKSPVWALRLFSTSEGHEGCVGTLRGAMNACCGHGQTGEAYIQWLDGSITSGAAAIELMCSASPPTRTIRPQ